MASTNRAHQAFGTKPHGDAPPVALATTPWPQTGDLLRVLVISEVRLFQEAFAALLGRQAGVCVVGMTNPLQAPVQTAELRPDIVLFDATRPGNLGYARTVADQVPPSKSWHSALPRPTPKSLPWRPPASRDTCVTMQQRKMWSLFSRARCATNSCVRRALRQRSVTMWRSCRGTVAGGPPTASSPVPALSKRELEIGDLIDRGLSNKQIARQLEIQATTVKNHVHNIFDKLKVHRRGEAAACLRSALRRTHRPPVDRAHQSAEGTPRRAGS